MADEFEDDLVERAGRGDETAMPFLVSYIGDQLLGYARAVAPELGDVDRERIVEVAVEAGVRALGRFDPARGSLRAWFRKQVRWKVAEWRRSGPPPAVELPPEPTAAPEDTNPLPGDVAAAIRKALGSLSFDHRLILALRGAEGLAFAEIAQRLDIEEDAARQRYRRALPRARSALEHLPELAPYLKRGVL